MKKRIISVEKVDDRGMVVTFDRRDVEECLEAVEMVIASAVTRMKQGGMDKEDIRKQVEILADYGMRRGMERAGIEKGGMKHIVKRSIEIRVENAKREIERAAIENGLNLTVYEGKIGFVDQGKRKIVALWEAKYRLREESGI